MVARPDPARPGLAGADPVGAAPLALARAAPPAKSRILILGMNYAPEPVGIAIYTTGLARRLAAHGHAVSVIAASPYYPAWKPMAGWRRFWTAADDVATDGDAAHGDRLAKGPAGAAPNPAPPRVIRCPHYIPAAPSGAKRILHHLSFAAAALVPVLWRAWRDRPDEVFVVAPSTIAAPLGRLAARLAGARCWLHVQDFEVEAAFSTGLLAGEGRLARLARWFERRVLTGFDVVSSISPAMCQRLIDKGVQPARVTELRNWAETDRIAPLERPSDYRALWGLEGRKVALYSGNIANKQGIEVIIKAAKLLEDRKGIVFVICGEGPNLARLKRLAGAAADSAGNLRFHPLQPMDRLGELLGLADLHILPQIAGAADLVLPSKLANMLASGRPVIATAAETTGLAAEMRGCGRVTPPGDAAALAAAVAALAEDPATCAQLGAAARKRAVSHWDRAAVLDGLEARLTGGALRPEIAAAPDEDAPRARAAG